MRRPRISPTRVPSLSVWRDQQGVTLLEMMIAVGLTSMVVLGAMSVIKGMNSSRLLAQAKVSVTAESGILLKAIQKDLAAGAAIAIGANGGSAPLQVKNCPKWYIFSQFNHANPAACNCPSPGACYPQPVYDSQVLAVGLANSHTAVYSIHCADNAADHFLPTDSFTITGCSAPGDFGLTCPAGQRPMVQRQEWINGGAVVSTTYFPKGKGAAGNAVAMTACFDMPDYTKPFANVTINTVALRPSDRAPLVYSQSTSFSVKSVMSDTMNAMP